VRASFDLIDLTPGVRATLDRDVDDRDRRLP